MNQAADGQSHFAKLRAFFAGNRRILIVALCKLLVCGFLFYLVFYSKLHELGVFRSMTEDYTKLNDTLAALSLPTLGYSVYFIGGLILSAVLYLCAVAVAGIRRRVAFLVYAAFFGIDILFVLQPSGLLLTVLFSTLVLASLRIRRVPLRYTLASLTVAVYAVLVSPAAAVIIPIYLISRLWQRNDLHAIRLCTVCVLVFCLLYQTGLISRIYEYHPAIDSAATYRRLFPDENYMGHVAYYLADTAVIFLRILVPVEVFLKFDLILWIFAAAQLATVVLMLRRIRRILQINWKMPIRSEDRLQTDVLIVLIGFLFSLCFTATDPMPTLRLISGCYPLLLFLTFSANERAVYPVLDRDLSEACPVVFCHSGDDDYAYDALQRAGRSCGFKNVVLIGAECNRGFVSNWFDGSTLNEEDISVFRKIYTPIGPEETRDFDRACFERHFALYGLMTKKNIDRCFLCDSDVLVYGDLCNLPVDGVDFACTGTASAEFLEETISPHCAYWTRPRLRQFLNFVLHIYQSNTTWLEAVCHRQEGEGKPARSTDTVLLTAWCKIVARYDKAFRYRNLCEVDNGVVWDFALTTPDNLVKDEYVFDERRKLKQFVFKDHIPYFTRREDGSEVGAMCLHCRGCSSLLPVLLRESHNSILYALNRLMYGRRNPWV